MKKTLIITLALVFVLSIAGTAFAANPFVDVPANHWAYGAVAKLAKAGVVDGMGDGTYQGARNMTRYEMAQIVAKAMAKADKADAANKALIEKLEAEFAAELNNLGVRVSNLEAKVGTVKVTADARLRYLNDETIGGPDDSKTQLRFRLHLNAKVNDDTTFYGRVQAMNHNEFGSTSADKLYMQEANFTIKNFLNSDVTAKVGRFGQKLLQVGYFADTDGMVDGAKVMFGDKAKVTLGYADFAPIAGTTTVGTGSSAVTTEDMQDAFFANVDYALSKATAISAMYFKEQTGAKAYDVWGLGFKSQFNPDWYVAADYSKNTEKLNDPVLYVGRLGYKGANKAVAGSWGAYVEYFKAEADANDDGLTGAAVKLEGRKGWNVNFSTTLAKNIVLEAWQTFNQKVADGTHEGDELADRTRVQINFYF